MARGDPVSDAPTLSLIGRTGGEANRATARGHVVDSLGSAGIIGRLPVCPRRQVPRHAAGAVPSGGATERQSAMKRFNWVLGGVAVLALTSATPAADEP